MNIDEMVKYWLKSAEEDLRTAESLFINKRYHHCLFFCHLFIEKTIKALVVRKTGQPAPYGHKLTKLTKLTGLKFSENQMDLLDEITAFNIEARYNDYKFQFYKKATRGYTQKYIRKAKEIYLWLRKHLSTGK